MIYLEVREGIDGMGIYSDPKLSLAEVNAVASDPVASRDFVSALATSGKIRTEFVGHYPKEDVYPAKLQQAVHISNALNAAGVECMVLGPS